MSFRLAVATTVLTLGVAAWDARSSAPARPTYAQHVRPILQTGCVPCHREGEAAPFSLEGYEAAKKWASMTVRVTESRQMPPWLSADKGRFHDERRLSEVDIATLRNWEATGAPEGHAYSAVPALPPKTRGGWPLGKPDAVIRLEQPYRVKEAGPEIYRYFVFENPYDEVKWLRAIHPRPGNPGVVHHMSVMTDASGDATRWDRSHRDGQPGYTSMGGSRFRPSGVMGVWAPGAEVRPFPAETAMALRPHDRIVVLVHYSPSGKEEVDQWQLGLYLTSEPKREIRMGAVEAQEISIPAGKKDHRVTAAISVPEDITLLGVIPHLHALGAKFKGSVVNEQGERTGLIDIPAWDPAWQTAYWYREPVRVAQGSRMEIEGIFDNSAENPRNPSNPPKRVKLGEASTEEMCNLIFMYTVDVPVSRG